MNNQFLIDGETLTDKVVKAVEKRCYEGSLIFTVTDTKDDVDLTTIVLERISNDIDGIVAKVIKELQNEAYYNG